MTHVWTPWAALRRKGRLASRAVAVAALASSALLTGAATASAAPAASTAAPTYANLLNGGFEVPQVGANACALYTKGSTAMKPWTVTAGSVHLTGDPGCGYPPYTWKPHGGGQSLDLDGVAAGGPGAISQTFSTVTGHDYQVQFWVSGNAYGGDRVKTFTVGAAPGGTAQDYSFDTGETPSPTATMPAYKKMSYEFTASGSSTTLTFTSTTTGLGAMPFS